MILHRFRAGTPAAPAQAPSDSLPSAASPLTPPTPPTPPEVVIIPPSSPFAQEMLARAPWWMLPSLGFVVLMIFTGALAASCFMDNDTLRTQMFAIAGAGFTTALGFFFGSSAGSQKKDETIAASSAALAISAPVVPLPSGGG